MTWTASLPDAIVGIVIAHEYLDNVPVDVAEVAADGIPRLVLVDPTTGVERLGGPISGEDAAWCSRWWPLDGAPPGARAEIGRARDAAWAAVVSRVQRGIAVAIDYDHGLDDRPLDRNADGVPQWPRGGRDPGRFVRHHRARGARRLLRGRRWPRVRPLRHWSGRQTRSARWGWLPPARRSTGPARTHSATYARSLGPERLPSCSIEAGLGAFGWLVQGIGVPVPERLARIE